MSRTFETFLQNYQFCRKSENDAYNRGWEFMLLASLWRIACKNRYASYPFFRTSFNGFFFKTVGKKPIERYLALVLRVNGCFNLSGSCFKRILPEICARLFYYRVYARFVNVSISGKRLFIINASSQKVRKSSKQISIPVSFLNNSIKLYSNFSLSHDTTKLF